MTGKEIVFITLTTDVKVLKLFSLIMMIQNKLDCLSSARLFVFNLYAIVVSGKEKCFITLTTDVKVIKLFFIADDDTK